MSAREVVTEEEMADLYVQGWGTCKRLYFLEATTDAVRVWLAEWAHKNGVPGEWYGRGAKQKAQAALRKALAALEERRENEQSNNSD